MEMFEIVQLWNTYQDALAQKEGELSRLYGVPFFLMGRSVEFALLGALVGILAYVVGVAL